MELCRAVLKQLRSGLTARIAPPLLWRIDRWRHHVREEPEKQIQRQDTDAPTLAVIQTKVVILRGCRRKRSRRCWTVLIPYTCQLFVRKYGNALHCTWLATGMYVNRCIEWNIVSHIVKSDPFLDCTICIDAITKDLHSTIVWFVECLIYSLRGWRLESIRRRWNSTGWRQVKGCNTWKTSTPPSLAPNGVLTSASTTCWNKLKPAVDDSGISKLRTDTVRLLAHTWYAKLCLPGSCTIRALKIGYLAAVEFAAACTWAKQSPKKIHIMHITWEDRQDFLSLLDSTPFENIF